MEQWKVERTAGVCDGSGQRWNRARNITPRSLIPPQVFERKDFSIEYWDQNKPEVYSFWKTIIPQPNEKKKLFVDDSVLINFFERLAQETDQLKVNFRFVLALILMRKRKLKYEDTLRQDNKEIWVMRFVRETDTHKVEILSSTMNKSNRSLRKLSAILHGEF